MTRLYMHEYIKISGHHRAAYFEHMTTKWRQGAKERNQKTFGVWGTVGSTADWPQVVNLWEYESMEIFAASLDHETQGKGMQDPFLEKWWAEAQPMRESGYDRLLYPASYSPSIDETIERGIVGYRTFRHEIITTKPGKARDYIDRVEKDWLPVAKSLGMECIGAYRTAMRNDTEVMMIWAFKDYATWGKAELALDGQPGQKWRAAVGDIVTHEIAHLMASAPTSPTQTGHQP